MSEPVEPDLFAREVPEPVTAAPAPAPAPVTEDDAAPTTAETPLLCRSDQDWGATSAWSASEESAASCVTSAPEPMMMMTRSASGCPT